MQVTVCELPMSRMTGNFAHGCSPHAWQEPGCVLIQWHVVLTSLEKV